MGGGAYLCKYLEKEYQKDVPDEFMNVGRFWGTSRGCVADPIVLDAQALDTNLKCDEHAQYSIQITRILGKLHENRMKSYKSSSRIRHGGQSSVGSYLSVPFKRLLSSFTGRDSVLSPDLLVLHKKINLRISNIPF
jgi:hypothetical protein